MKRATANFGYAELRCTIDVLNDLFKDEDLVKNVKQQLEKRLVEMN